MWVALVGEPSTRKSPILNIVAHPLKKIDGELARRYVAEKAKYDTLPADHRKKVDPPKKRRLRIEDTTIEGAQEILKDSPHGVLSLQDELSGWFGAMDKCNCGRGAQKDRGFWLQSFSGGEYVTDRVQRGTVFIENLSVSLLGGIQPDAMRAVMEDAIDDGLIQRLIPVRLRGGGEGDDQEKPPVVEAYWGLVERLAGKQQSGDFRSSGPLVIKFSPAAQEVRRRLEKHHSALMACELGYRKLASHIGKYDGVFARLCLIFHCIERPWADDISEDVALRVEAFLHKFLLPHAVSFYADMVRGGKDRIADIAEHILAHRLTEVTARDVGRCVRSTKNLSSKDVRDDLETLEALGWLTREQGARVDSVTWKVNPRCHELFAEKAAAEKARRGEAYAQLKSIGCVNA